jgi:plasmid maintenance system antidote protein VapI
MFSKIERGERRVKRDQVIKMAKLFEADEKELLTLWLASQINELVKGEEEITKEAIKVVEQNL